jgi:hypothetical protein
MTALIGTDRAAVEAWVKQIYEITPEVLSQILMHITRSLFQEALKP